MVQIKNYFFKKLNFYPNLRFFYIKQDIYKDLRQAKKQLEATYTYILRYLGGFGGGKSILYKDDKDF